LGEVKLDRAMCDVYIHMSSHSNHVIMCSC
jgi:hypothetical protein